MKPLIVLLVSFIAALFILKFTQGKYNFSLSARIAFSIMLLFTALGHFLFTEGMSMMIPNVIPFKKLLIYITALLEILGAMGLHIPKYRSLSAWLLIFLFILILPANIKAATEQLNYQTGTYDGKGIMYLWFRVPLQILFIVWVYLSTIKFQ